MVSGLEDTGSFVDLVALLQCEEGPTYPKLPGLCGNPPPKPPSLLFPCNLSREGKLLGSLPCLIKDVGCGDKKEDDYDHN